MRTLLFKTDIKCSQEELFNFHLDSNNITKITPPNIKVKLLDDDGKSYEGKKVKIKTTKLFIPTYWEVEIKKLESPKILIDEALKSPFNYWRHLHVFNKKDDCCELQDVVEYKLPFGFLGTIIEPLITNDIKKMFEYRHQKTKEILEKGL